MKGDENNEKQFVTLTDKCKIKIIKSNLLLNEGLNFRK